MARPLRIEYAGAVYHVTSRGNARQKIYFDDADRELFLAKLSEATERYGFVVHAYCLMGNHYHLLVETPKPNLSLGMQRINGEYTQAFNRRHRRVGHLFQGRFKAIVVEKGSHLLELSRYVVLNPVRARMVKRPQDWPWSSYRATAGLGACPSFLTAGWILSQFGTDEGEACARYRRFVSEGLKTNLSPLKEVEGQIVLGGSGFAERQRDRIQAKRGTKEHPRAQRQIARPSLRDLFEGCSRSERAVLASKAKDAHVTHGYTLKAIADYLGIHYATAGRLVRAALGKGNE